MTFIECVHTCATNPDFVNNYDRLTGNNFKSITASKSSIDRLIDEATGFEKDQVLKFSDFVLAFVWLPVYEQESKKSE